MKNITVLVALILGISTNYGQATIKGKITDNDHQELVGASVLLKGKSKGSTTNFDGNYIIENISEGTYIVQFSYVGFVTLEKEVQLKNNEILTLDVKLLENAETLQEVEIVGRKATTYKNDITYATRMPIAVKDAPIAINTTTKELLRDLNIVDFEQAIKTLPGVVAKGDGAFSNRFNIRGFRNNRQFLINGTKLDVGWYSPFQLPNVERIEALMGASSALYGNASPGGSINIVTKKPLDKPINFLKFSTGSYNTNRVEGDFTGPLNDNKTILYRLNMAYNKSEGRVLLGGSNSLFVSPSVTFKPNDKTNVNVEFTYSNVEGIPTGGIPLRKRNLENTPVDFSVNQLSDYNKNLTTMFGITLNHKFTDNLSLVANYLGCVYNTDISRHFFNSFISDTKYNLAYQYRDVITKSTGYNAYLKGKFQLNSTIEFNPIIGFDAFKNHSDQGSFFAHGEANGVEPFDVEKPKHIKRDALKYKRSWGFSRGENIWEDRNIGFYVMGHFKIGEKINAVFNTRLDKIKRDNINGSLVSTKEYNVITPRFALSYKVTDYLNAFANYSRYFTPVPSSYNPKDGDTDYLDKPTRSVTYEGGLKASLFRKKLFTTLTAYYIPRENVVTRSQINKLQDIQTNEISRGLEFTANGRVLPNWNLSLSYAYNHIKTTFDPEEGLASSEGEIRNEGKQNIGTPFFTASGFTKYRITDGLFRGISFGVGGNYVSERRSGALGYVYPSYFVVNANLFYNIGKFEMGLMVDNITDKKYIISGYKTTVNIGNPANYMLTVGYKF